MSSKQPIVPQPGLVEDGVEVPHEDIDPGTLRNMVEEFVSRDGADWGEAGGSMEDKITQVLRQFKAGKVRIVFDLTSQTANIVEKNIR